MRLAHLRVPVATILNTVMTLVVFLGVVYFLQALTREIARSPLFGRASSVPSEYQQTLIRFLADGTYHKIEVTVTHSARGPHQRYAKVYDARDNLLWEGASSGENTRQYLQWASSGHLHFNGRWLASRYAVRAEFSRALEVLVKVGEDSYLAWRYQPRDRIFTGYDMRGAEVGYLGRNGFVTERVRCQSFDRLVGFQAWAPAGPGDRIMLWVTARGLYQIHFTDQSMETHFHSPEVAIGQVRFLGWLPQSSEDDDYADPNLYRPLIDCETEDGAHHLVLRDPYELIHCNAPVYSEAETIRRVQVTATREAIYAVHREARIPGPNEPWPRQWDRILYNINPAGELQEITRATGHLRSNVRVEDGRSAFEQSLRAVSPLAYAMFDPRWLFGEGVLSTELLQWFASVIPIGVGAYVVSLLGTVFVGVHVWKRQPSWSTRGVWLVVAGLFNVAGLFTYLALNHTVLVRCAACGKKRSLTSRTCMHCAMGLPRPQPEHTILIPA